MRKGLNGINFLPQNQALPQTKLALNVVAPRIREEHFNHDPLICIHHAGQAAYEGYRAVFDADAAGGYEFVPVGGPRKSHGV